MRNFLRFLIVIFLLFSAQGEKKAYSKNLSPAEFQEIEFQNELSDYTEEVMPEEMENTLIRIFVGIYNIQDKRFKKIYTGQGFIYGFGLAQRVYSAKKHNLFISLDFEFYSKKGKSTVTEQETKLIFKPISLGGVYLFAKKKIFPFAEIGLDYFPYKEESVLHSTSGTAWGFHIKGGAIIPFPALKSLKAKLSIKYTIAKTEENNLEVNLGGIEYRLCLMYGFDLF